MFSLTVYKPTEPWNKNKIVDAWVSMIGLDQTQYGTHTMRRTKPSLIYKKLKI